MGRNSGGGSRRSSSGGSSGGRRSGGRSRSFSSGGRGGRASFGSFGGGHSSPPPRGGGSFFGGPRPGPGPFPPPPPPPRRPFWRRPAPYYGGGPVYRRRSGCGCAGGITAVVMVLLIAVFSGFFLIQRSCSRRPSTPPSAYQPQGTGQPAVTESVDSAEIKQYYTDRLGWIDRPAVLLSGMKQFYEATGVRPYLYLTDEVDGSREPTEQEVDSFAQALYDELFTDENHFLFLFQEYGDTYMTWYVCGNDTGEALDDDALDDFLNLIDQYYHSDLEDDEYFGTVYAKAADRLR